MISNKKINWYPTIYIISMHLLALLGIFFFTWKALWVCLLLHWVTGCLGITLCYHRLLTHNSFKVPKWLEYTLAIIGCMASQGSPRIWVGTHRLHHANTDVEGDPHSPVFGFFDSHMGWTFKRSPHIYHLVANLNSAFYLFLDGVHFLFNIPLAILLYYWGGWSFVIWGIFVRTVLVWHSTWSVNSFAHVWGYTNYKTNDNSKNNWIVALLTFGEGWHSNHHAFQTSARHGIKWWEYDITFYIIKLLESIGLATSVKIPVRYILDLKKK